MENKTNVMRILDAKKIVYTVHDYSHSGVISGSDVAEYLGQDPAAVFKTLVTVGKSGNYYVFMIPVRQELDLKKAARCVGEKNIEMIRSKDLLPLTGYIHGGCSPIGMKKQFRTAVDSSVQTQEKILFSGGRIGYQIETSLEEMKKVFPFTLFDLCKSE